MPPLVCRSTSRAFTVATLAGVLSATLSGACSDATTAPAAPPKTVLDPAALAVGDLVALNTNTASACDRPAAGIRIGRVTAVGAHAVILADTSNPAGGFTTEDYQGFAAAFDSLVYPVDVRHFGMPADAVSGGRALVFYTSAVNALTPRGVDYYVGGFFWVRDLFPTATTTIAGQKVDGCAGSNASEMFYMLVPDPAGTVNGNVRTRDFVARGTVATLGHEFQHLINASRRLYTVGTNNFLEELWLNEGLSHIAEELDFYRASGLSAPGMAGQSPHARLTPARIGASPGGIDALNGYEQQNLARLSLYLKSPEQFGPYVPETTSGATTTYDFLEMRGAIWSFLRYAADRSGRTDSAFFRPIVDGTQTGIANLQTATGLGPALTDWLRDWAVTTYADGAVPTSDPRFSQPSWDFRQVLTGFTLQGGGRINGGVYPLATRALVGAQAQAFTLRGGTSAYLEFTVPAGTTATVRTQTGAGGALASAIRVSVVAPDAPAAAATVTTYDAGAGGTATVVNASSGVARYALVLFDADPNYDATQSVTVTGTGLGAAPTPLVASLDAASLGTPIAGAAPPATSPLLARLAGPAVAGSTTASVAAEPLMSDAPVLARLHTLARRELPARVAGARAAYRVQRLVGPPVVGRRMW